MVRESLGLLFVKYFLVSVVLRWDSCYWGGVCFWWGEGDSSNIYFVSYRSLWYFAGPWDKCSPFCILGLEDNGELSMVNPSSFPIDLWLSGCKLWVS